MLMTCSTCIFVLCIYCEARLLTFSSLNCRYLSFIHATKCFTDFFFFWLYHPCIWSTVAWRIIVWLQEKEIGIKNSRIRCVNILLLGIAFKKYGFTLCFICWNALCNYNAIETFVIFFLVFRLSILCWIPNFLYVWKHTLITQCFGWHSSQSFSWQSNGFGWWNKLQNLIYII